MGSLRVNVVVVVVVIVVVVVVVVVGVGVGVVVVQAILRQILASKGFEYRSLLQKNGDDRGKVL